MKKKRFTEQQIIGFLKKAEAGVANQLRRQREDLHLLQDCGDLLNTKTLGLHGISVPSRFGFPRKLTKPVALFSESRSHPNLSYLLQLNRNSRFRHHSK